jgi:uncharacterized membrane protein YqaE (UPF0057 family)
MSPSTTLICVYILVMPRLAVWLKSGFRSLDFLISVLLGLLTPTPNFILTTEKYDHRLLLLLWLPGVLHAQYVAGRPDQWPKMSNTLLAYTTMFIIVFFPFMAVFARRGVRSLDFACSMVLWWVGTVAGWYLEASNRDSYVLRFVCFLPCMVHACYILGTYPDLSPDNDRSLEARTGTHTVIGEGQKTKA